LRLNQLSVIPGEVQGLADKRHLAYVCLTNIAYVGVQHIANVCLTNIAYVWLTNIAHVPFYT